MTQKIFLSGKNTDLFVLVDDEDYWLNQYKWYLDTKWGYAKNIKDMQKLGKSCLMHRVIMNITDPNILLDHIDRFPRNNQKENLRTCSALQNAKNAKPRSDSKSKYRGVRWDSDKNIWRAGITSDKKIIHGGYFIDEILAAIRHDQLARLYHKEFAYLNFPEVTDYTDVDKYLLTQQKELDSKYIGVCRNDCNKINPWSATLCITETLNNIKKQRTINIGHFNTDIEAAKAYDKCLFEHKHLRYRKPIYNFPELINE